MVDKEITNSGIDVLGDLPWGSHFCNFFNTKQDLLEILLPFFRAGLENNEYCLWVTSTPITVNEAVQALKQEVPNLGKYVAKQGIEIISDTDWYIKEGIFNPKDVTAGWHQKLNQALEMGYIGMRVNGGEGWLEGEELWRNFLDYEMALNNSIFDKHIIVLCSYPLEKCSASMVLDVAHVHEMVLSKRNERWEILEVPDLKKTKAQLNKMNEMLEKRVAERTRKLEIAVTKLKEEIAAREKNEEELEKIANDLIQRSTDLQQFAYIVSHNLRAPIANILGLSDILKGNHSSEDQSKIQQFLFNAVEQLDEMIKDLNKILQTKFEITEKKEIVYFSEMVDNIKSSIRNLIEKENVQILTDFSAIDNITTIKSYIHSIFYNLIQNSIKYKQPGKSPVIQIKSAKYKGKTRISFKDNGIGIDIKKHGKKIFGLYKRFHLSIEGKGVGLFMVKTQVEVLGGSISIKSEPNVGTEFIIELPIRPYYDLHKHTR
jgi:signal transduction histidine kinase